MRITKYEANPGTFPHIAIPTASIIGYSHGGAVAQQLALDYPARVQRLILACTYAYNRLSWRERVESVLVPWLVRLLGIKRIAQLVVRHSAREHLTPQQTAHLSALISANQTRQMVAALRAVMQFDTRPRLYEIIVPTCVIAGSADEAVALHHAHLLAACIPGAELRIIEGAGHTLLWTHTATFLSLRESFLGEE